MKTVTKFVSLIVLFMVLLIPFCYGQKQLGTQIIGELPTSIIANADNFGVAIGSRTYVRISSNSGTANQRTLIFGIGAVVGQVVFVEFVGINSVEIGDNSLLTGGGNLRLSANFNMTQHDILALLWNGTDWIQLYRSVN